MSTQAARVSCLVAGPDLVALGGAPGLVSNSSWETLTLPGRRPHVVLLSGELRRVGAWGRGVRERQCGLREAADRDVNTPGHAGQHHVLFS